MMTVNEQLKHMCKMSHKTHMKYSTILTEQSDSGNKKKKK